jgi:xanthine dehydrogenase YagT iron-sulfur-binding subunit
MTASELNQEAPFIDERVSYDLQVNSKNYLVTNAWYFESLLSVLRDRLELTGTKFGCGHGQCSACTVYVDNKAVNSCLELAVATVGCKITTIEG